MPSQEKLTEELRESMKKSRKESELTTVDSQIRGLESRLKYAITDRDTTVSLQRNTCGRKSVSTIYTVRRLQTVFCCS